MSPFSDAPERKCAQCSITAEKHQNLYGTPLGRLAFSFQPDQGAVVQGEVFLCRPCTHEVLSERILRAAGVGDETLVAETWK